MANTWIVRFYNKGEFKFTDPNAEEFSSLSGYEQKMIIYSRYILLHLDIQKS